MKTYNKPITEIHNVELQSMIAATTPEPPVVNDNADTTDGYYDDAKQSTLPTSSLWDEEE